MTGHTEAELHEFLDAIVYALDVGWGDYSAGAERDHLVQTRSIPVRVAVADALKPGADMGRMARWIRSYADEHYPIPEHLEPDVHGPIANQEDGTEVEL